MSRSLVLAADMELDRDHRALARRILLASVCSEAFRLYLGRRPEQDAVCPFLCCDRGPQTLTHMFVTCPLSLTVGVGCVAPADRAQAPTVGQRVAGR